MHHSIPVERRVAITIWCLATPAEYSTVAHLFGVAHSTVCEIVCTTCTAIVESLQSTYINISDGNILNSVVDNFVTKWGVP